MRLPQSVTSGQIEVNPATLRLFLMLGVLLIVSYEINWKNLVLGYAGQIEQCGQGISNRKFTGTYENVSSLVGSTTPPVLVSDYFLKDAYRANCLGGKNRNGIYF